MSLLLPSFQGIEPGKAKDRTRPALEIQVLVVQIQPFSRITAVGKEWYLYWFCEEMKN